MFESERTLPYAMSRECGVPLPLTPADDSQMYAPLPCYASTLITDLARFYSAWIIVAWATDAKHE